MKIQVLSRKCERCALTFTRLSENLGKGMRAKGIFYIARGQGTNFFDWKILNPTLTSENNYLGVCSCKKLKGLIEDFVVQQLLKCNR